MSLSGALVTGAIFQKILVTGMPTFLPAVMMDYAGSHGAGITESHPFAGIDTCSDRIGDGDRSLLYQDE
jgi:hypothetical protein